MATIQGIYIALFGRPADPGGLAYWNSATNNGSDLSKLMGQLTTSKEYTDRFAGKSNVDIVTSVYQALFGRAPDAEGLTFFTNGLNNGSIKLESIAINIMDGAKSTDKTVIDNKVLAADLFTKSLDTPAEIAAYTGNSAAELGRTFLSKVTSDSKTIPAQADVDKSVANVVQPSGGQAPAEGGGGGGSQPSGPTTQPNTYKINDVVSANNGNKLYVNSGNSADGFAITNNPNNGVELGLSVRQRYGDVADNGVANNSTKVVTFYDQKIDQLAFAYSVAKSGGLDVANNTYKLIVDTDPTAASATKAQFILAADASTASKYKWVYDANNNGVIDNGETLAITDDGKSTDGHAVQNIQPLAWLLSPPVTNPTNLGKPGLYDIKLVATDTAGNSTESAIQIHASKATLTGDVSKASTGNLWVGTGNSAEKFATVELGEGIELGLSGRYKQGSVETGTVKSDGLVHFSMSAGDTARFAYSAETTGNQKLSDYTFKLLIDKDPSTGTPDYLTYTLDTGPASSVDETTHLPKNSGGDSQYIWRLSPGSNAGAIKDDGGNAAGTVTQNIENIGWFDNVNGDSLAAGSRYDVVLEAWSKDGTTLIGTNHVVFDIIGNSSVA